MTELAQLVEAWPLAASMAAAVAVRGLRAGRRRSALNEALHELRRPLQAIALASGPGGAGPGGIEGSLQLAAAALERLDREVNGGSLSAVRETVQARPLLESAVARWRLRADLAGGSLELRWEAGGALLSGDRAGLAQALDNLIVNAIEHGGPAIVVGAGQRGGRLRVCVADFGRAAPEVPRQAEPAGAVARLRGWRRHGHGLAVVRRVAAAHGGRFTLRRSEHGSFAVLELPLAADPPALAA